jgi:hypothetical protein
VAITFASSTTTYGEEPDAKSVFESSRPGFYLSLGGVGTDLRLDLEDPAFFTSLGLEVNRIGDGGFIQAGYGFGRGFALELAVVNTVHTTGRTDVDAHFTRLRLDAVAPLIRNGRLQPFLVGGIGAAGLSFTGTGVNDTIVSGALADMGVGLDLHFWRHFAIAATYRYGLVNFREKTVSSSNGTQTLDFNGTGETNSWELRFTLSF